MLVWEVLCRPEEFKPLSGAFMSLIVTLVSSAVFTLIKILFYYLSSYEVNG